MKFKLFIILYSYIYIERERARLLILAGSITLINIICNSYYIIYICNIYNMCNIVLYIYVGI